MAHLSIRDIIKMVGLSGASATCSEQIGYSISDVTAKAVPLLLIELILVMGLPAAETEVPILR